MKNERIVMFTGDSVTDCGRARPIGDGFGKMGDSYMARIFVDTWADDPVHNIHYLNSAISGNTSKMLLDRYDTDVLAYQPDYVFIMIGINDVWRHFDGSRFNTTLISPEESAKNMECIINKTIAVGAKPVIISPFFINLSKEDAMRKMCDQVNEQYRALAARYDIGYIDVQGKIDEFLKAGGSTYLLSSDGVHPKSVGNSLISRCIYNHPAFRVIFS